MRGSQRTHRGRQGRKASPTTRNGSLRANIVLAVLSSLLALFALEFGYRIVAGEPVFTYVDWRRERVMDFAHRANVDPVLGWTLKAHHQSNGFNTLAHGIRRNFNETTIRTGAILAVGDSFTEGWDDVQDHETWPAHLERLTGIPVVNGAVGAYGTDQIVLRTEQLLPIVRPRTLIVGFFEEDVFRAGHSTFGGPKPHFKLENGELRFHPPNVLEQREEPKFLASVGDTLRIVLGYSAAADFLLARLVPYWYAGAHDSYGKVDNDALAVTCALLDRLKKRVDRDRIRMILFIQHSMERILEQKEPNNEVQLVADCAEALGIEVLDQFDSLRAIAVVDRDEYLSHYVKDGDQYEHMSSKGNEHAARLLAAALAKGRPARQAKRARARQGEGN